MKCIYRDRERENVSFFFLVEAKIGFVMHFYSSQASRYVHTVPKYEDTRKKGNQTK